MGEDNAIVKVRGVTAFTGYQDWLRDPASLAPYVQWSRALGVNWWRMFMTKGVVANSLPEFTPKTYGPTYYRLLPNFVRWCNESDVWPQLTLLTDCQVLGWGHSQQRAHVEQALDELRPVAGFCAVEIANEFWKNGVDPALFPASLFSGFLAARSATRDLPAAAMPAELAHVTPPLSFHGDHTPRDSEWPRKGKNLLEFSKLVWKFGVPCIAQEPERIQNMNTPDYAPGRDAADFAAVCELYGAGLVIHGDANTMQRCRVPGPTERKIADGIAAVWRDGGIPLDAASKGTYTRGPLPECGLVHTDAQFLRTFAMTMPGGKRQVCVRVRPTGPDTRKTQGGWTVENITGPHGQIVHLLR